MTNVLQCLKCYRIIRSRLLSWLLQNYSNMRPIWQISGTFKVHIWKAPNRWCVGEWISEKEQQREIQMRNGGEAGRNWACRARRCINNEAAMQQQPRTFSLFLSTIRYHLFLSPISPYRSRCIVSILSLSLWAPIILSFSPIPIFNLSLCNAPFLFFKPVIHSFLSLPSISLCLCSCIASLLKHGP